MKETFEKSLKTGKPLLAAFISAGKEEEKEMRHIKSELKSKAGDRIVTEVVDCSFHDDLRKKYKIDNYPTFILFKGEEQIWRGNTKNPEVIWESINSFI